MMRNGIKIRNPIWNAVRSSLTTNAGSRPWHRDIVDFGRARAGKAEEEINLAGRVCLSMNCCSGAEAFCSASVESIFFAM